MTKLEIAFVVIGTILLRPVIKDDMTYILVLMLYGAILGMISGLLKTRGK